MTDAPKMRLWLLEPVDGLPKELNRWEDGYGCALGFVVRAATEAEARALANAEAGEENDEHFGPIRRPAVGAWLEGKYSTCTELLPEGPAGVVLVDFHWA